MSDLAAGPSIAVFGTRAPDVEYRPRRAAYAVIRGDDGRLALVVAGAARFLVGGGCEDGEAPKDTIVREALEECGRAVEVLRPIGLAVQLFDADDGSYEMRATFMEARFLDTTRVRGEHELIWVTPQDAAEQMYHACHAWAVRQYLMRPTEAH